MPVPTVTRNLMLDALFGRPEYTDSFDPTTQEELQVHLYIGDPLVAGVEVSALDYPVYTVDASTTVYPDSSGGTFKVYAGPLVTYQAESNWGTVTHFTINVSDMTLSWVFELAAPVAMNTGMYLAIEMPSLTWTTGTTIVGMTDELRQRLIASMFGNPFIDDHSLAPGSWAFALYIGNPLSGGVEVSLPDYNRVSLPNDGGLWPSGGDPYTISLQSSSLVFPSAQNDWGEITHMGMINSNTGQLAHVIELDTPIDAVAGTLIVWLVDDLVITFGGPV